MSVEKIALQARRSPTSLYIDIFAAQAMFAAVLGTILAVVGELPRNADNFMQATYTIPTFLTLSLISGVLLWKRLLPHRALRIVCWCLVAFAMLAIPVTVLDVLSRSST